MSVNITYFVHGTTTDNKKGLSTGWNGGELSDLGKKQSLELRQRIQNKKFDVVFCSDLKRAVDSANLVFERRTIIFDKRLRECNYENLNGADSKLVESMDEKMINERFPNGESYKDVERRMKNFLEFLKNNYNGKSVAIMSHKAPQLALKVLFNRKTWPQAFAEDWRKTKSWQPGWKYVV